MGACLLLVFLIHWINPHLFNWTYPCLLYKILSGAFPGWFIYSTYNLREMLPRKWYVQVFHFHLRFNSPTFLFLCIFTDIFWFGHMLRHKCHLKCWRWIDIFLKINMLYDMVSYDLTMCLKMSPVFAMHQRLPSPPRLLIVFLYIYLVSNWIFASCVLDVL